MAIIVILANFLIPSLKTARARAFDAHCKSNLHQWGVLFGLYHQDHGDSFEPADFAGLDRYWPHTLRDYFSERRFLLCPLATTSRPPDFPYPGPARRGSTFHAWDTSTGGFGPLANYKSSYGRNGWASNPEGKSWYFSANPDTIAWRYTFLMERTDIVPMLFDSAWLGPLPLQSDSPPPDFDFIEPGGFGQNMRLLVLDRHDEKIDSLFVDGHVRNVGLKEVWTLKWHRQYRTDNRWTKAGGASPNDWPMWMRDFENF